MRKKQKAMLATGMIMAFITAGLILPRFVLAGDLEPPALPSDAGSAMYTLEDIYNRLSNNTTATKRAGEFTEPVAGPGSTSHTLDEIYELALPTKVAETGQTTSFATGDDGELQKGVTWPAPRFTNNGDGTVTDNLTGLIWLRNANRFIQRTWSNALSDCNNLADDGVNLTDGSSAGDWRLPNIHELRSLIDYGGYGPALPSGHPFTNVQTAFYWSSTTYAGTSIAAWHIVMNSGYLATSAKGSGNYVWPVRSGN